MFDKTEKRKKSQVEVELHLDDGSHYLGKFGVGMSERLSDVMNDERKFLPFETSEGHVIVIRKSTITQVVQLDQQVDPSKVTDPYEVLGVERDISDEDLNRSYRTLCAVNHPDKLHSAGLSSDFFLMANTRMARINDAYQRALAMRNAGRSDQTDDGAAPQAAG